MSFVILGDSNVEHFWQSALNDRKELRGQVAFSRAVNLSQIDSLLTAVASGHVVFSALTNPIVDHIESISPESPENLETSITTIITKLLDSVFQLCYRLTESKVIYMFMLLFCLIFGFVSYISVKFVFLNIQIFVSRVYVRFFFKEQTSI